MSSQWQTEFDWDNDGFGNTNESMKEMPMIHLTILAELPLIVEEIDSIDDDKPVNKLATVDDVILAAQAVANKLHSKYKSFERASRSK